MPGMQPSSFSFIARYDRGASCRSYLGLIFHLRAPSEPSLLKACQELLNYSEAERDALFEEMCSQLEAEERQAQEEAQQKEAARQREAALKL
jgi:hypothetical protein